jgi:hypothetical protein
MVVTCITMALLFATIIGKIENMVLPQQNM